jgi:hypothetical protein
LFEHDLFQKPASRSPAHALRRIAIRAASVAAFFTSGPISFVLPLFARARSIDSRFLFGGNIFQRRHRGTFQRAYFGIFEHGCMQPNTASIAAIVGIFSASREGLRKRDRE